MSINCLRRFKNPVPEEIIRQPEFGEKGGDRVRRRSPKKATHFSKRVTGSGNIALNGEKVAFSIPDPAQTDRVAQLLKNGNALLQAGRWRYPGYDRAGYLSRLRSESSQ